MRKLVLFSAWALLITGCVTKGANNLTDLDKPLADLQKVVVKSLPLGLRQTSPNGREFYSNYFVAKDRKFKPAANLAERNYAHVLVLGDRRPYDIQIMVKKERMDPAKRAAGYVEAGSDQSLTEVIKKRILLQLNKRREELNIIDDFRVF